MCYAWFRNLDAKNCWKRCRSRTASEPAKDAAASVVKLPVGTHTVLDDTLLCRFCLATALTRSLKKTLTFFLKFVTTTHSIFLKFAGGQNLPKGNIEMKLVTTTNATVKINQQFVSCETKSWTRYFQKLNQILSELDIWVRKCDKVLLPLTTHSFLQPDEINFRSEPK